MVKEDMNGHKFNFISTFAGCGGSSLGYKWAGGKELLAIDFDKNAHETFKLNFPEVVAWCRDIREVTAKEILKECFLQVGELDLLDGSPPCQGFSIAGKRQVSDNRNDLTMEFIRLINGLQPKVFVMENVKGMIQGKMKGYFKKYFKEFERCGYSVKAKLMNAKYYGVPQSRERIIIVGVKNKFEKEPSFPIANPKTISAQEACPELKGVEFITFRYRGQRDSLRKSNYPAPALTSRVGIKGRKPLNGKYYPSLAGFPNNFRWPNGEMVKKKQIGNAVMPKFMEAIAKHIVKIMDW